jgi:hypothetical protein
MMTKISKVQVCDATMMHLITKGGLIKKTLAQTALPKKTNPSILEGLKLF